MNCGGWKRKNRRTGGRRAGGDGGGREGGERGGGGEGDGGRRLWCSAIYEKETGKKKPAMTMTNWKDTVRHYGGACVGGGRIR
uniref:Uncharacterized protein n=1 Tax=Nelumbo nucifera TaxID=4432 RepID=A0A822XEH7_NELNU|nr:TPA_asm: hypothetical protein HUJ06_019755 [Nelumbo nucifera]